MYVQKYIETYTSINKYKYKEKRRWLVGYWRSELLIRVTAPDVNFRVITITGGLLER